MNSKKLKFSIVLLAGFLLFICGSSVQAQEAQQYQDLEALQEADMGYFTRIYRIAEDYPDFKYQYVYDNGELENVIVEGVPDDMDRKRLEVLIFDHHEAKERVKNIPTRMGVYYSCDREAAPGIGWRSFFSNLQNNLVYPEEAERKEIEGTVFVDFVVDSDGEIGYLETDVRNLEARVPDLRVIDQLREEARRAVQETSGIWEPSMVGDKPVASRVVIPVTFQLEPHPTLPYGFLR